MEFWQRAGSDRLLGGQARLYAGPRQLLCESQLTQRQVTGCSSFQGEADEVPEDQRKEKKQEQASSQRGAGSQAIWSAVMTQTQIWINQETQTYIYFFRLINWLELWTAASGLCSTMHWPWSCCLCYIALSLCQSSVMLKSVPAFVEGGVYLPWLNYIVREHG